MEINFIPLDYDYFSLEGKTYMKIFGRTQDNKQACIIDETTNFFYILSKKPEKILEKIRKIKDVKRAELVSKNYMEKPVKAIKVFSEPNKMQEISHKIGKIDKEKETYERDINITKRYILERKIKPLVWYKISGEIISDLDFGGISKSLDINLVIKLEKAEEAKKQTEFKPKVLAFDIETEEFEIGRGEILMISLVSEGIKKVLTWKTKSKKSLKFVENFRSEAEMIEAFQNHVNKIKPDIITGYFSDVFDFPYLRARAEKNDIDLKLGVGESRILFSRGRPLNSRIKGLIHIDLLKFIETVYSQYLQSETLSLDEVAKELVGESKLEIDHHKKAHERNGKEWEKFLEYNLQDSILTYKLFQKLWPDFLEFTKIIQEPLFIINRQGLSGLVESYIIHNLERFNEIAEKRPLHEEIGKRRMRKKIEGAFVLQPEAGLYKNLCIFDFTSMHTSIIVSFNISKSTLLKKKTKNSYESPELNFEAKKTKFYFSKKPGFFSLLSEEIIKLRKKYKQEYKKNSNPITKARSNAFKLLSASIHGYVSFFGARYYSAEASSSILAFVRELNKQTINKTNKAGYKVIYADTDSVAFTLDKKTKQETLNFLKKLNSQLPGVMELGLEDFYKRGIWVTKRTKEFGAKKKYALINHQGKLKIRGFETVRRDWCNLARKVQNKILKKILEEGNEKSALKYVKKIIEKLKKRKIEKKELIIRTQLKKPLSEYIAISPHVAIARKMQEKGEPVDAGMLIRYYIAESKQKRALVRDRAKLPEEKGNYDINYYLKHQLLPAVENIFEVFNINTEEIIEGKRQMKLDGF